MPMTGRTALNVPAAPPRSPRGRPTGGRRARLAQRLLQRPLCGPRERGAPGGRPPRGQRARPERRLDAVADGVEIDPERRERVAVELVAGDLGPQHGGVEPDRARTPEHQVLGADPLVPERLRLGPGALDDRPRVLGESLEHQPFSLLLRPCLRCTACLDTPSAAPTCSQDQPRSRALATCSASRRSASVRSDATAARPTAGSVLSTAPARSRVSCADMASTYVDGSVLSTDVDDLHSG